MNGTAWTTIIAIFYGLLQEKLPKVNLIIVIINRIHKIQSLIHKLLECL